MRIFAGSLATYYGGAADVEVVGRLQRWLDDANQSLAAHVAAPLCLAWDTDRPVDMVVPDAVIHAVRLLAGYAQYSELPWPDDVPDAWQDDPAWQQASAGDFGTTRFPQVLIPDIWMPGDFAFTARQPMPDGEEMLLGSLIGLTEQLTNLNQQTLQVPAATLLAGLEAAPPPADRRDFLQLAEYGLALWVTAAVYARNAGTALVIRAA